MRNPFNVYSRDFFGKLKVTVVDRYLQVMGEQNPRPSVPPRGILEYLTGTNSFVQSFGAYLEDQVVYQPFAPRAVARMLDVMVAALSVLVRSYQGSIKQTLSPPIEYRGDLPIRAPKNNSTAPLTPWRPYWSPFE